MIADEIVCLAKRLKNGQVLHVLLTGCNTISLVNPLRAKVPAELQSLINMGIGSVHR